MLAQAENIFDWAAYFTLFGFFLFAYVCLRLASISATSLPRESFFKKSKHPPVFDGKAIETTALNHRIQNIREALTQGKTPQRPASFKRALAVENKRAEMAKLAFFQSQPTSPPNPQDPEDSLHLLLV